MACVTMFIIYITVKAMSLTVTSKPIDSYERPVSIDLFFNGAKRTVSASVIKGVAYGKHLAITTCKKQFTWSQWNCPEDDFMKNFQTEVTKEDGYIQAIRSAAITYQLAKNCSRGELPGCTCTRDDSSPVYDEESDSGIITGCSDRVDVGEMVSVEILDWKKPNKNLRTVAYNYNNALGRKMVKDSLERVCVCVDGSSNCNIQLCKNLLPEFSIIAAKIKNAYDNAKIFKNEVDDDMQAIFYIDYSPNYCLSSKLRNWPGIEGRVCSTSTTRGRVHFKKHCKDLCLTCGYNVKKTEITVKKSCNCRFQWCCGIVCEECNVNIFEYSCQR